MGQETISVEKTSCPRDRTLILEEAKAYKRLFDLYVLVFLQVGFWWGGGGFLFNKFKVLVPYIVFILE